MPVPRTLLTVLALAAGACALSAPVALAGVPAGGSGTVLSAGGHTVRLVDKAHRVGNVHVASARGLRRGDVVRVQHGRARVSGHVRLRPTANGVKQEPPLPVAVELARGAEPDARLSEEIRERLRAVLVVSTQVELVPWGSFERSEYKSKLVERQ